MEIPSSGDQYNLKWNNHLANFIQTFIEHQNGESLVDVTLSCEGQYIKAHKLILSACSDYFHSIFQVHGTVQHPIILLNGVKFVDLKYILHFMYHGEVKVMDKDLPSVLALGETLQIKGLSSVKLRDVPSEDGPPATIRASKRPNRSTIPRIEPKVYTSQMPSVPLPVPPVPLPSEIPYYVSSHNGSKVSFANKRGKSPSIASPGPMHRPEAHSVYLEETPPKKLVKPESPPITSSPKSLTSSTNNIDALKEIKNPMPKPPHAFMIFANEWRKKLTIEHPEENNKEISVRLGNMWKNLLPETKNVYYKAAKRAEDEHKAKYPDYDVSSDTLKRKSDVLNDSTNTTSSPTASLNPLDIVEIQDQVFISDSDS